MMGLTRIAVLIPARDEQELLPRCLQSVNVARRLLPPTVASDVIVVSDSSVDGTENVARAVLAGHGPHKVLVTSAGNVGEARSIAAAAALRRHASSSPACLWLANTDADCIVPPTWLADQLHHATRGVAALAGIIDVDSFEEHEPRVADLFRRTYHLYEDGTHPHVHGANLGLRADAYLHAGGWYPLRTGEDHDLWKRVRHAGYSHLSLSSLCVTTSGRRCARAPHGFAAALAAHNGTAA